MSELLKMTIYAFSNQEFTQKSGKEFSLQVNPSTIKYGKEIAVTKTGPLGGQFRAPKYSHHENISLNFETLLDATGVLSAPVKDISEKVDDLEKLVYDINKEIHRPNYLKISWGTFIFNGVLVSINYEYTLFAPSGLPLRVKISFSFVGYMEKMQAARKENKLSPDMSRIVTIKAGDSIPKYCNEIYGDASYCYEIAKHNKLSSFRNIKPGTELMFPSLIRHGRITG
ncbi:MAG: hypothetical protein LBJ72_07920 [Dysgonamonadaceae bacterium]|jgi:hypothetical protein|nr:hypothetical protein [Dysgonamonadaceae bacterium]